MNLKLPIVSGEKAIKTFEKIGYKVVRIKIFIFYLLPNKSSLLTLISATRMQSLPHSSENL